MYYVLSTSVHLYIYTKEITQLILFHKGKVHNMPSILIEQTYFL